MIYYNDSSKGNILGSSVQRNSTPLTYTAAVSCVYFYHSSKEIILKLLKRLLKQTLLKKYHLLKK